MSAAAADTSRRALGTLEPGLLPVLRLYVTVSAGLVPVLMRSVGVTTGIILPWDRRLLLSVLVHLSIVGYTWAPWGRRHLGPAFLPAGLSLFAAYTLAEKYLTVQY